MAVRKLTIFLIIIFSSVIIFAIKLMTLEEQVIPSSVQIIYTEENEKSSEKAGPIEEIPNYFNRTLKGNGVIKKFIGGIGNQLFQYACSFALAQDRQCPLYIFVQNPNITLPEISHSRKFLPNNREYAMDKFQIAHVSFIDKSTVIDRSSIVHLSDSQMLSREYSGKPFQRPGGGAYCQSEAYFIKYKKEILSMFELKPEVIQDFPEYVTALKKEIESSEESVAVHVRRGDFTRSVGFFTPISYQRSAIRRMIKLLAKSRKPKSKTRPKFFVFSDDIDYVRKNLGDLEKVHEFVFVSTILSTSGTEIRLTSLEDFYLMTKCKHFIIANSTFGWWAAYLSTERDKRTNPKSSKPIVIASAFNPEFWKLFADKNKRDFYRMLHGQMYHPKEWVVIDPFVGEL